MRKFRTLSLTILALVGITGLILYRNKYEELHQLLDQDMGLFGLGSLIGRDCLTLNESVVRPRDTDGYGFPPTTWTKLDHFFFFSAFSSGSRVRAIGIGPPTIDAARYRCQIWTDYRDLITSEVGKLRIVPLNKSQSPYVGYEFECEISKPPSLGSLYMFDFVDSVTREKAFIPIQWKRAGSHVRNSSALCVFPDMSGIEKKNIVEFVGFHQTVGFSDLIVYDIGIHYGLLATLKLLSTETNSFKSFTIVRWNFPVSDGELSDSLIKKDCQYRTSSEAKFVVTLHWSEYLLPGKNIPTIIPNVQSVNIHGQMMVYRCCVEYDDNPKSERTWPAILKKTTCLAEPIVASPLMVINPSLGEIDHSNDPTRMDGAIHRLELCRALKGRHRLTTLYTAHKYLTDLMMNKIYRLWKSGHYFNY